MSALPIPQRELFVNGSWVKPVRGKYLDVVSPATEGGRLIRHVQGVGGGGGSGMQNQEVVMAAAQHVFALVLLRPA
jgi:hypothetical protein